MKLSIPDLNALKHSDALTHLIRQEIENANGFLSFARFMELALFAPGLGYYSAGQHKLGEHGDFITAPEISPLFAQTIARQFHQILSSPDRKRDDILEFGAGSGIFAKDVLLELEKLHALPTHYYILEVSGDLRERQQTLLNNHIPHLFDRIHWLDSLPKKMNGIIFANEVMDTFPVHLFRIEKTGIKERCVAWQNNQFVWTVREPTTKILKDSLEQLKQECHLQTPYESEINLMLSPWINSIVSILNTGIILLFDYGYGRKEYYHPDRTMGTFMCYSKQRGHANPFEQVGLQDITAHVDFTRVIESVDLDKCSLAGFTTQADFLLACGLLSIAEENNVTDPVEQYQKAQAIKKLILPGEMGELIKVIALQKKFPEPLLGFRLSDRRFSLS